MSFFNKKPKLTEEEKRKELNKYVFFIVESRKIDISDKEIGDKFKKNKCDANLVQRAWTIADYKNDLKGGMNMRFGKKEAREEEQFEDIQDEEQIEEQEVEETKPAMKRKPLPQQDDEEIASSVKQARAPQEVKDDFVYFHIPERVGIASKSTGKPIVEGPDFVGEILAKLCNDVAQLKKSMVG